MRILDDGRLPRRPGLGSGFVLVALALVLAWPVTAWAGVGDYRCTDPGRVYLGNPRLIRKPAVVSADRVYQRIPEYRKIVD